MMGPNRHGIQFEAWHFNGDEVAWTDMVNRSGPAWPCQADPFQSATASPANAGMREWSASGNYPVLNQAFLMQDGGDAFSCGNDYDWIIQR